MKTHEITLTLRIKSRADEARVRRLLELTLCDTTHSHADHPEPFEQYKIVGVDAGVNPCKLASLPYRHGGVSYSHIVAWRRKVAA